METIVFYILASLAVVSAISFVLNKNPMYGILSLIVTMFSIAGLYIMLNAQFLGIVQIIVYAGAIMVLFLYILMMLNLNNETRHRKDAWKLIAGAISGGILLISLLGMLKGYTSSAAQGSLNAGLTKNLGLLLFNQYVLPFEVASVLILAGIVGAVFIGKKDI